VAVGVGATAAKAVVETSPRIVGYWLAGCAGTGTYSSRSLTAVLRIRIRKDPKLLPSRIWIRIRNKLISTGRIRIRNYHWGSGLLKAKCSDKNTIFNIKSSILAQK